MFHRVAENTKDSGQWCEGRQEGREVVPGTTHTHTSSKQPTDLCHDTQEQGCIEIQEQQEKDKNVQTNYGMSLIDVFNRGKLCPLMS